MTKRQFVVIAFRLFALYLLFNLISNVGYLFNSTLFHESRTTSIIISSFATCAALFLISLLWRKSDWLMQKVFAIPILSDVTPENDIIKNEPSQKLNEVAINNESDIIEEPIIMDYYETPISIESIELVAFSLLGLWAIIISIPTLVKEVNVSLDGPIYYSIGNSIRWAIMPHLIQFGVGIWLFLRPWQFQGWIEKFKQKDESSEEGTTTAP